MKLLVTLALCAFCVSAEALARQKRGWQQEPPPPPPPTQSPGWGWKPPPPPPPENKGWNQPPPTQSPGWGWSPPQQQNNGWGWQGGRRTSPYDYGYSRPTYGGSKPWGRYERYTDDPYSSYRNEGPYRYRDFGAIRSSSNYPRRASSQIGF